MVEAWVALSVLYAGGIGVETDPVQALMWLEMATAAGVITDTAFREALTAGMTADQIAEAKRLAYARLARNPAAQP